MLYMFYIYSILANTSSWWMRASRTLCSSQFKRCQVGSAIQYFMRIALMVTPAESKHVGNLQAASVDLAACIDAWTLIGLVLCICCAGCTGLLCAWFEETTIRVKPRLYPARKAGAMRVKQHRHWGTRHAAYVARHNLKLHSALACVSCTPWGLCKASWFHAACGLVAKRRRLHTVTRCVPFTRRPFCTSPVATVPANGHVQKHWLLRGGTVARKKEQKLLEALSKVLRNYGDEDDYEDDYPQDADYWQPTHDQQEWWDAPTRSWAQVVATPQPCADEGLLHALKKLVANHSNGCCAAQFVA